MITKFRYITSLSYKSKNFLLKKKGVASGCLYLGSLIIVSQYFDKKKGIAIGVTMSGSGMGSFAMAPLVTFLLAKYDWKVAMIVCGGLVLQCCIMGALLRPCPTRLVSKNMYV